tara:strand:- start:2894 stop:3286 length:393 start_codon:yes stop_codon:yes gene_type:complete
MFHEYPYKATIPISIDRKYPTKVINKKEDIDEIVQMLIDDFKNQGDDNLLCANISSQLPFFCCSNTFLSDSSQRDIARYQYSKDYSISPYPGSYGEQPLLWKEKHFLIQIAKNYMEEKAMKDKQKGNNNG